MITGFNTDIEFQGVTYHVQTEDKGLDTPLILSLVYDRGTILASKRSPYNDLLAGEFNEKELMERLQRQHKLICAAIRAGRIDDLKRMTMKESASKQKGLVAQKEVKIVAENEPAKVEKKREEVPEPELLTTAPVEKTQATKKTSPKTPEKIEVKPPLEEVLEIPVEILEDLVIEEVQIVEEETILPAEAVEIVTEVVKNEQPVDHNLTIELLNDVTLKGGERKTLSVLVKRGSSENGLSGAHVMVKLIGSSFRPLIFHAKTDSNGVAVVQVQLPHFSRGRAAVLVKAMSGGEETELRRVIQQG